MTIQIAVRIPEEIAAALDEFVQAGEFENRADAVRSALDEFVDRQRRRRIGEEIAEGYRRLPQTDEEVKVATAAAISSINEEPW